MIKFLMVDVQSVASSVPRSNFLEADLDFLADKLLESGGILKPLVLKKTGFEKYEVVDGHFEYYAAVRAREKNPDAGEMVNALIIPLESEDVVVKQVEALRAVYSLDKQPKIPSNTSSSNLESRITNIELRLEKQINQWREEQAEEKQKLDKRLKEIETHVTQRIKPLDAFNTLSKEELAIKLQRSKITRAEKIAKAIVDARRKKKKFEDYRDVLQSIKGCGLGEKRMLTIIDEWSRA
jgi:hypothetical protein